MPRPRRAHELIEPVPAERSLGPRAALEELAATLPRSVRFGGDLGAGAGQEVESAFCEAVAAVLNLLAAAGSAAEPAIAVEFGRDDALRARVTCPAGTRSASYLRVALGRDAERIAAAGGALDCAVADGTAIITVSLVDATASPGRGRDGAFDQRVLDLVRRGRLAVGDGPDRDRWDAVEARAGTPPRLAVVTDDPVDPEVLSEATALGIDVVVVDGPADAALAERFLDEDGPHGSIDAVFASPAPTPAFLAALRRSRQRVAVSRLDGLGEAARELAERAPVIAARRALVSVRGLMSGLPQEHPLRWEVDQLAAEAHEITELDLLDELLAGGIRLPRGVGEDAARLLGARGTDPRTRLALGAAADEEQVCAAAQREVLRWRAQAGAVGFGGRNAVLCEVLVRTAEGLLNSARTS
ncbi:hypothetical protein [Saccharopolyspora sp. NPDC002578]